MKVYCNYMVLLALSLFSLTIQAMDLEKEFIRAVLNGKIDKVRGLVNAGVDINTRYQGITPLVWAIKKGYSDIANQLLKYGADVTIRDDNGMTALTYAANYGNREIIEPLIDYGADIDARNNKGETALIIALLKGNKEIAKLLLKRGAKVNIQENSDGWTALMIAILKGCRDIVEELLSHGADVTIRDNYGDTALDMARVKRDQAIIDLLEAKQKQITRV